jgi:hypothetical protein
LGCSSSPPPGGRLSRSSCCVHGRVVIQASAVNLCTPVVVFPPQTLLPKHQEPTKTPLKTPQNGPKPPPQKGPPSPRGRAPISTFQRWSPTSRRASGTTPSTSHRWGGLFGGERAAYLCF